MWAENFGCLVDTRVLATWMRDASTEGMGYVYENAQNVYPPLTLYILSGLGKTFSPGNPGATSPALTEVFALRLVTVYFDILTLALLYAISSHVEVFKPVLLVVASYAVNWVDLYLTGWWGQIEAWFTFFLLLSSWYLIKRKVLLAWLALGISVTLKQPAVIALPILLVGTWKWFGLKNLVKGMLIFGGVVLLVSLPLVLAGQIDVYLTRITQTVRHFPWISLNSYNLWYAVTPRARGIGMDFNHDHNRFLFDISYRDWGLILFSLGYGVLLTLVILRREPMAIFATLGVCWLTFFTLNTRIHARYLFPALVMFLCAGCENRKWWWIYGLLTITMSINIFVRACEISPSTCTQLLTVDPLMKVWMAMTNVITLLFSIFIYARSSLKVGLSYLRDRRYPLLFSIVVGWILGVLVVVTMAWQAHTLGEQAGTLKKQIVSRSVEVLGNVEVSEDVVIVNWPREIKSTKSRNALPLPITAPSAFISRGERETGDAIFVQYEPWHETSTTMIVPQYHGEYVTQSELRHLVAQSDQALVFNPRIERLYVMANSLDRPRSQDRVAEFGEDIVLTDVSVASDHRALRVILTWRVTGTLRKDVTIFVHALDASGQVVAQHDGNPAKGLLTLFYLGEKGKLLEETRLLPKLTGVDEIGVGVYDVNNGNRLSVLCVSGFECQDQMLLIDIP
jgi:Gpi18-like mannosyltransferase